MWEKAVKYWKELDTAIGVTKGLAKRSGSRLLGRMATGAALGAGRGALDNLWGDRQSMLGGAMQGAMYGAGYHFIRRGMLRRGIGAARIGKIRGMPSFSNRMNRIAAGKLRRGLR